MHDRTGEKVEQLAQTFPITLIRRGKKLRLGTVYVRAFKYAYEHNAQYVIQMDADGSHDPQEIHRLLEAIKKGYDAVIGARYIQGGAIEWWSVWRYILSWSRGYLARLILNIRVHDMTSGYRCYRRSVLKALI